MTQQTVGVNHHAGLAGSLDFAYHTRRKMSGFQLIGDRLALSMNEHGAEVVLEDRRSGTRWRLVARNVRRFRHEAFAANATGQPATVRPIGPGRAERLGDEVIRSTHRSEAGTVSLRWVLERDRLRVIAEAAGAQGINALALPATFRPDDEAGFLSSVPNCQGVLHTGKGPAFSKPLFSKRHQGGFTLDDPAVQQAIAHAKPVLALHQRIAKLEMVEHHLHRPDGAVQETVFTDGTRVIVNFANVALEAPGVGLMEAESWIARS